MTDNKPIIKFEGFWEGACGEIELYENFVRLKREGFILKKIRIKDIYFEDIASISVSKPRLAGFIHGSIDLQFLSKMIIFSFKSEDEYNKALGIAKYIEGKNKIIYEKLEKNPRGIGHLNSNHGKLLLEQVSEKDIIDSEMGNDRFVALTKDNVYFVSIGISSGHFWGKKVKSFSIESITSIDIGRKVLASYMEITAAGMGGLAYAGASYAEFNENRIFFPNNKLKRFQEIASKIRGLMKESKNPNPKNSDADEIEKLYSLMQKGIITKEEFGERKEHLLNR